MKKVIRSSVDESTYTFHGQPFSVKIYNDDPYALKMQITEIHPYDDAEYAWARCGYSGLRFVEFFKAGKKLPKTMQLSTWDGPDYEDDYEYISDAVDEICRKLSELNAYVEPRMIHW